MMNTKIILLAMLLGVLSFVETKGQDHYDIVVYGGTSAGVTAAVQAARMGKNVVMVCPGQNIGGLTSSGLGATDINNREAIGGIAREFYSRIYEYYSHKGAWNYTTRESYFDLVNNWPSGNKKVQRVWGGKNDVMEIMWVFEPHVAQKIFREMLLEAGVKVIFNERLDLKKGVIKKGAAIQSIQMESGRQISGRVFIDTSYEGDLMAKADVSYFVGRESNKQYKENLNGIFYTGLMGMDFNNGISDVSIDPFVIKGDPSSGLLPFIEAKPPGRVGEADKRIQSYCYRFTLSNDQRNLRPVEKPSNFNPLWYEHIARVLEINPDIEIQKVITVTPMPNKKTDMNHCDFVGVNYEWPEGDYALRDSLAQMHKDYALGKVWFLQNDLRVPERIRMKMREYGLPRDEFQDNDNFPYEPYIREARRMISDYVMTENNALGTRTAPNSIALGTYSIDSHVVSHFIDNENKVWIEGAFFKPNGGIYPISYQSIIPKKKECSNLIVPVCLSSSHAAYGSIRMEPVYMVMGQSAAIAASLAIDKEVAVQDLDYESLQPELINYKQLISVENISEKD